jgi:hypothetical protein
MGSTHDWMEAIFFGAFWGIVMTLWSGPRRAPDGSKTGWSWADGVAAVPSSLIFGIGMVFGWRAFLRPLVLMLIAALTALSLVARLAPLKPPPVDKSPYRQ